LDAAEGYSRQVEAEESEAEVNDQDKLKAALKRLGEIRVRVVSGDCHLSMAIEAITDALSALSSQPPQPPASSVTLDELANLLYTTTDPPLGWTGCQAAARAVLARLNITAEAEVSPNVGTICSRCGGLNGVHASGCAPVTTKGPATIAAEKAWFGQPATVESPKPDATGVEKGRTLGEINYRAHWGDRNNEIWSQSQRQKDWQAAAQAVVDAFVDKLNQYELAALIRNVHKDGNWIQIGEAVIERLRALASAPSPVPVEAKMVNNPG